MRATLRLIGFAILAGSLSFAPGSTGPAPAAERSVRGVQQIGGTWDVTWLNRRGIKRKGHISIEQRGSQVSARIYRPGDEMVTATGSIAGSFISLGGTRMGIPFTVEARVQGRRMAGALRALTLERRFSGTRRRR